MDFRILGSLQVLDRNTEIPVPGAKLRSLLALLLLDRNRPVSEDALIEALWADGASPKAADNLHVLVSRLRRMLGSDRIVRDGGGYRIVVEEGELDLDRFEELRAARRFDEALAVWRGAPLADFAYAPWAQHEVQRLEELRLLAVEGRIDRELEAGRHAEVVGELQCLAAEQPLREEFRRQLILALYRSGRQAEALEAYRATKRMLDEELGLEPSPALRELERAVLTQDPALDAPRPPARAVIAGGRRRRGALAAAGAAVLAFAGAAAAFGLVEQRDDRRRAAAATLSAGSERSTTAGVRGRSSAVTTRVVVVREQREAKEKTQPTEKRRRPQPPPAITLAPPPAPPPPPAAAEPAATPRANAAPVRTKEKRTAKPQPAAAPQRFADDFEDGIRNRSLWHEVVTGTGVRLFERNGRLEFEFDPDGKAGGDFNVLGAHYGTQCRFVGDFDFRVDYELGDWPTANGVMLQINAWFSTGPSLSMARQSQAWGEEYASFGPRTNARATDDRRGALRIRRVDGVLSAHYRSGGEWVSVGSLRTSRAATIALQAFTTDELFGRKAVTAALDNFVLFAEQPVC